MQLPKGAAGVELGCGGGYPVSRILDNAGFRLWAVDGSPRLVSSFQSRFPHIPVQCARVQDWDFFNRQYDFAIAIGLLFMLNESDQASLVMSIANVLAPGGHCLLTAPIESGRWQDLITGHECISLGLYRYQAIFDAAGFRMKTTLLDSGGNNYYQLQLVS